MINKDILGGGGSLAKDYTHIITVADSGYCYGIQLGAYGSINDTRLDFGTFDRLYSYYNTSQGQYGEITGFLLLEQDIPSSLYIARSDTKLLLSDIAIDPNREWRAISYIRIFNSSDVGKEVPVWISTTPPPWI